MLLQPVELDETDRQLAARLLEKKSAEEIAAALVKMHRSRLPAPEDLLAGGAPQPRERGGPDEVRPGFEDSAWFRMSVGRRQKADPRWLLPLLCRRGHITKGEVGAIRIGDAETFVQIPRAAAKKFADAIKRAPTDGDDGDIRIEAASGPPSQERRGPLRPKPGGFSRPNGPGRPQQRGPMRTKRKNPAPR
jgi:ATP-dependent RNA helicase DeaD